MRRYITARLLATQDTDNLITDWRYKTLSQLLIDKQFPVHIYLELSRSCNYKCKMCARNDSSAGYMPINLAEKVINEAKQFGATSFSLHLYGEPLLSPYVERVIRLIKESNRHNTVLLTTNGSLMTEQVSAKLIDAKVDAIFVSIPSLLGYRYWHITGEGSSDLEKVLNNMARFIKLRNVNKIPKLYGRIYDQDINKIPLCDKVIIRKYHNFGGSSTCSQYEPDLLYPCYHPWYTLAVNYNGNVTICCADYNNKILLGNAFNETLESIWKSDKVKKLRSEHLGYRPTNICANCDVWNVKPDIFFEWQKGK